MNYQQELIPGTDVPILAGVDIGEGGAVTKNTPDGSLIIVKTPETLEGYRDLLADCDLIVIERLLPFGRMKAEEGGPVNATRITDNSAYSRYREVNGFIQGMGLNVHQILPQAWFRFLGLPKKSKIPESMWKDFLHSHACQVFPGRKIHKYAADSALLFHVARLIHPMNRDKWP